MSLNALFPPEMVDWLTRYGLALAFWTVVVLVIALSFRPIALWWSGRSETNDRLRRLEETQKKLLLELEMLNKTLSIPLKRQAKKDPEPEEPLVVTQETKEQFLKALKRS